MSHKLSDETRNAIIEALDIDADCKASDKALGRKLFDAYYDASKFMPDDGLSAASFEELNERAERADRLGELYDKWMAETE